MQTLSENIIQTFGSQGKQWLQSLPEIIAMGKARWQLNDLQPVTNMSWHYVAKANSVTHGPIVLKIGCDAKSMANEAKALQHFSGHGMVQLIEYDPQHHMLLLQQAVPGTLLCHHPSEDIKHTIHHYADVVKQLTSVPQKQSNQFPHISDWLKALERADKSQFPAGWLERAIDLKETLLNANLEAVILHGDLHHENILANGSAWIAIDPKGIIGDIAFEAAAFNFLQQNETDLQNAPQLFIERCNLLSAALQLDSQHLQQWVFVRLILAACWMLEDNGSPNKFLQLASKLFP
jgi:streptomycin 6-kinase